MSSEIDIAHLSLAERLALDPEEQRAFLASLTEAEADVLQYDWSFWGRPKQLAPPGNWHFLLVLAGRGFGKTRSGAQWCQAQAESGTCGRMALVAETAADARDVMVRGESGILAIAPPWCRPTYEPSNRRLVWPNGAMATTYSADEPDQLRGPQHDGAWCFIAGTRVRTPWGEKPIEGIRPGALVWTRAGWRRVSGLSCRAGDVGRVVFSNGAELVGTAGHPVLTPEGWTRLSELARGARVCVIGASTSTASVGIGTAPATTNIAEPEARGIATTSSAYQRDSTPLCTGRRRRLLAWIGRLAPMRLLRALVAALSRARCSGTSASQCASAASTAGPTSDERRPVSVDTAEPRSEAFAATFAASVASTWAPAGRQLVFNLQVDGTPEYAANGIVVHNCDELGKWRYPDAWDQLCFGLRLGSNPRAIITTTPRPTKIVKDLIADPLCYVVRGSTRENRANVSERWLSHILAKYQGTRLGRQELEAEVLDDAPGALWKRVRIEQLRVKRHPALVRIVVAIDPSVSATSEAAETGIIVMGIGEDDHGYVLGDVSLIKPTPEEWGSAAVTAYHMHEADAIVGEVNNGGDLVEANVESIEKNLPFKQVRASRGKAVRAEPIATIYEKGRIHHVGTFPILEDQLCQWEPGVSSWSPNRLDALVWAATELMAGPDYDDGRAFSVKSSRQG